MFDTLSDRLQAALGDVRSRGKLTEDDVNKAMRQIRLALLEADVNFKVVKEFTAAVKERALGEQVLESLNPGQQVVKIVNEELTALMGGSGRELAFAKPGPTVILMAGLQGSGKTTACGKLARHLREEHGMDVALAACDVYRPAAVDQLVKVGGAGRRDRLRAGHRPRPGRHRRVGARPGEAGRARRADRRHVRPPAHRRGADGGAGRRQEADQAAQRAARGRRDDRPGRRQRGREFAETAHFDGVVLTKLDGDARGGAALSVKAVTGKPIIYASTGEKLDDFERFHPDRMAQRILGMGDVLTLVEKAEQQIDERQAQELERKIRKEQFTLDDFLEQMKQIRNMGPLGEPAEDDARRGRSSSGS